MEAGEAGVLVKVVGMVGNQEVCEREACAVDCCNGESTFLHMLGGTGSAYHQALRAACHAQVSDVLDHLRRCAHTTSEHGMLSAIGLRVRAWVHARVGAEWTVWRRLRAHRSHAPPCASLPRGEGAR